MREDVRDRCAGCWQNIHAQRILRDLLALIHGDDGSKTEELGLEGSASEAWNKFCYYRYPVENEQEPGF